MLSEIEMVCVREVALAAGRLWLRFVPFMRNTIIVSLLQTRGETCGLALKLAVAESG